ncbi:MAG: hypothetical protein GY851_33285 [bacterium]|nr:hypothetical protein [bacterium]
MHTSIPASIRSRRFAMAALTVLCLFVAPVTMALTGSGETGGVEYAIFAPDWTWQNQSINILVVLTNPSEASAEVDVRLVFPEGKTDDFTYDGPGTQPVTVAAGETVRTAFTNVLAKNDVPLQTYDFGFTVTYGGTSADVAYALRTIRGQAIRGGRFVAIVVPTAVALVWCIAFAMALKRFAKPGAWRTVSEPVDEQEDKEAWIDQTP